MKAVITGAGGFVGRALVSRLQASGRFDRLHLADVRPTTYPHGPGIDWVAGDLRRPAVRRLVTSGGADVLFHLAGVMSGAAERDYALSRRVNLEATLDLVEELAAASQRPPRVVYASTIAVFGAPLPCSVDDETPAAPAMTYGAHKLMIEIALADLSRRGVVDAISLRLPGVLARPPAPSGMTSAFISEVFHALAAGRPFIAPVSRDATIWAMSVECAARNLVRAATVDGGLLPASRALTLPALRLSFGDLVDHIAAATNAERGLVEYRPDAAIESQFASAPPLKTPGAYRAGFRHDGDVKALVTAALAAFSTN